MAILTSNKLVDKPQNPEDFTKWFESFLGYNHVDYPGYYDMVTNKLKMSFINSRFWQTLAQELPNINDQYTMAKAAPLLTDLKAPEIHTKPLESLLIKA